MLSNLLQVSQVAVGGGVRGCRPQLVLLPTSPNCLPNLGELCPSSCVRTLMDVEAFSLLTAKAGGLWARGETGP